MEKFSFKIEGTEVDDLLKVVGSQKEVSKKDDEDTCLICGTSLEGINTLIHAWTLPGGSIKENISKNCRHCGFIKVYRDYK